MTNLQDILAISNQRRTAVERLRVENERLAKEVAFLQNEVQRARAQLMDCERIRGQRDAYADYRLAAKVENERLRAELAAEREEVERWKREVQRLEEGPWA